jgi:3-phosphoshikimate 1-carboxyvinyltransferase
MSLLTIPAPSSKSLSHRALVAAALAKGVSRLSHVLESDDTARTREALGALGARFERIGPETFTVTGMAGTVASPATKDGEKALDIFVGESGTTCRLLTAVLAAGRGRFRVYGAGRMHERPVGELADALTGLGARFIFEQNQGCPPFVLAASGLDASGLPENTAEIGCDESSQYLSGLLLALPLGRECILRLGGGRVVSWPYVSLTLQTMEQFGVVLAVDTLRDGVWRENDWRSVTEIRPGELRFRIRPGFYKAGDFAVEGDWRGASYFLAAGAIGPHPVRVPGLNQRSLQGDAALTGILADMGAKVQWDAEGLTIFPSLLHGVDVDMGQCPDLAPTVAALAAHARGTSRIRGAAHLKIKESDRIAAMAAELTTSGCTVALKDDGMALRPPDNGLTPPEKGGVFSTHGDHRIAMSVSLLGLPGTGGGKGFPVLLDDPACVAKSFPRFWTFWDRVRA